MEHITSYQQELHHQLIIKQKQMWPLQFAICGTPPHHHLHDQLITPAARPLLFSCRTVASAGCDAAISAREVAFPPTSASQRHAGSSSVSVDGATAAGSGELTSKGSDSSAFTGHAPWYLMIRTEYEYLCSMIRSTFSTKEQYDKPDVCNVCNDTVCLCVHVFKP